jgi:hypothetical protein
MKQLGWLLFAAWTLFAADVNTFSIVGYDPGNGDCGVAVRRRVDAAGSA